MIGDHDVSSDDRPIEDAARPWSSRIRVTPARVIACAAVWVTCLGATAVAATFTSFGMVVLPLSANHGVHLGDVLIALGAVTVASIGSWLILRPIAA